MFKIKQEVIYNNKVYKIEKKIFQNKLVSGYLLKGNGLSIKVTKKELLDQNKIKTLLPEEERINLETFNNGNESDLDYTYDELRLLIIKYHLALIGAEEKVQKKVIKDKKNEEIAPLDAMDKFLKTHDYYVIKENQPIPVNRTERKENLIDREMKRRKKFKTTI